MKKISVIVPVYNIEKYLDRCIKSITEQSYKNLEIILVDDGSTDSSPDICKKWAKADDRITCIFQKNSGVQLAREAGVKAATGDYISFVDSDDWLDTTAIERMLSLAEDSSCKIVSCAYHLTHGEKLPIVEEERARSEVLDLQKIFRHLYDKNLWSIWGKLFARELFNSVPRLDVKLTVSEDLLLDYFLYKQAGEVLVTSDKLYYYFRHSDSVISKPINERRIADSMTAYRIIAEDMDKSSKAYIYHIANLVSNDFLLLNETIKHNTCRKCRKELIKEIISYKNFVNMPENSYCFKTRHKLSVLMLQVFPPAYYLMIKLLR